MLKPTESRYLSLATGEFVLAIFIAYLSILMFKNFSFPEYDIEVVLIISIL